jgi:peptidoglycan/xylan/chitin deacetylase (PgdA/CDA1 family)
MRSALKRAAEFLLLHGGAARALRTRMAGRALVLAYHNVVPDGAHIVGERALHLPRERFAQQLDALQERCRVVSLDQALSPDGRELRVVITFDDAYHGAVTAGVDEVVRRGLPATIFVATGRLGGGAFWWDSLAPAVGEWSTEHRRHALDACRGLEDEVTAWAARAGLERTEPPRHARTADLSTLRDAVSRPGITLGSHTVRHPNLTRLDAAQLDRELIDSRAWLEAEFGAAAIPWLSYPYGLASERVAAAAARAGYTGAFRVSGGWMPAGRSALHCLPRLNVASGLSRDGFSLRISGLLAR